MKKEEKKIKKRGCSNSQEADAKKKRVAVRVRKSNKKSTQTRVTHPKSIYCLRDYPKDDDWELEASNGSNREAKPSLARETKGKQVATASREDTPALREAAVSLTSRSLCLT